MMISNGWMKDYNETPLFVLMEETNTTETLEKDDRRSAPMDVDTEVDEREAREKMDQDQQLPLNIYEMLVTSEQAGAIFVNLEFELETFEPERIAVEEVFKAQPMTGPSVLPLKSAAAKATDTNDSLDDRASLKLKEEEDAIQPPPVSASSLHIQSLQSSIE